jgi:hypothetical protein
MSSPAAKSPYAGYRFPAEVIELCRELGDGVMEAAYRGG